MKQSLSFVLLNFLILGNQDSLGQAYLLDSNCGVSKYTYRIAGGRDADLMSAPWMAYLHSNSRFICGGSLVNHWFVLTAAHCFKPNNGTIYVRLGENDASRRIDCDQFECAPSHSEYWILQKFIYPYYKNARYYDIALVKLNRNVIYTESIRPICVILNPQWQEYLNSIPNFIVSGWGATNTADESDKLQIVKLPQVHRSTCRSWFGYNVDRTQICAGEAKRYVGKGDSGGPLGSMVNYGNSRRFVQFGIVSHLRHPFQGVSVFTNVLSYANWIYQIIQSDTSNIY
ncbi:serine protease grass [Drosophila ficusphila]|uniref:serine protease grass n=1 Tax=Drosophila ficusphila TaxID=30025 RepID=UPI0007E817DA|nr:serine protease grass [Drosophila ficusphila]